MCKAIKEMLRDSRQEGRKEGRQEGRQEGQDEMATLIGKLILSNRISELLKVTTDKEYRNKLLIEYNNRIRKRGKDNSLPASVDM